jgi:hypothetical protein
MTKSQGLRQVGRKQRPAGEGLSPQVGAGSGWVRPEGTSVRISTRGYETEHAVIDS